MLLKLIYVSIFLLQFQTDDPCTLTSPLWDAEGSINELDRACCDDVLHGTETYYDDWVGIVVYG